MRNRTAVPLVCLLLKCDHLAWVAFVGPAFKCGCLGEGSHQIPESHLMTFPWPRAPTPSYSHLDEACLYAFVAVWVFFLK